MKSFKQIREDGVVATNNVGSGNIAGVGVGPQGEPGGPQANLLKKKAKLTNILNRKNQQRN